MLKHLIIFITGGAIGAVVTYKIVSQKDYDKKEQEIAEIRSFYNNEFKAQILKLKEAENAKNEAKIDENSEKIAENEPKYVENVKNIVKKHIEPVISNMRNSENGFENVMNEPEPKKKISADKSIISSTEFVDDEDYEKVTLYYFEDDDLFTDTDYNIRDNGIDIVGRENLDQVGLYEDDVLYVRNDSLYTDFEVIFQHNAYGEMFN